LLTENYCIIIIVHFTNVTHQKYHIAAVDYYRAIGMVHIAAAENHSVSIATNMDSIHPLNNNGDENNVVNQ